MKALIIIDMQNDFVTGSLGTPEAEVVVNKIKEKINTNEYDFIFFTRDTHDRDYLSTQEGIKLPIKHCIKETSGWCIVDELYETVYKKKINHYIINKTSFGYDNWDLFYSTKTGNSKELNIDIVGVCTDICVISNALILKAKHPEVTITVDASCCAGTTPEMHQKALDVMKSCQIDIINEGK